MQDLTIGQAARLAGVTAKALRHYDRIGLLRPALVDPATGYRRYRAEQVAQARLIRRLRALELPLEEIRRLIGLDELAGSPDASGPRSARVDAAALAEALDEHGQRIEARLTRLRGILHTLDHVRTGDWIRMTEPASELMLTPEQHRKIGIDLFNDTWRWMEKEDRTPDEDALMLHQAHSSLFHWLQSNSLPQHAARGEWQVSRVYCVLRRAEPALYHAKRVLDICQRNGIGDWDLAFAYEALARAYSAAGDRDEARRCVEQARLVEIAEQDDREAVAADLETIPL